ncbi:MAG: M1 family metallopeptidase [FCB group bacterium]|nr:M1 family metallopeptidase [FCB group bacterium]
MIMRNVVIGLLLWGCLCNIVLAEYWQNEVAYTIQVTLDDSLHRISGDEKIVFTNNSPDQLDRLVLLLYPNAYKDTTTEFAREAIGNGYKKFYFAGDDERGWIEIENLRIEGKNSEYSFFENNIDLAEISLDEPLKPGQSIEITMDFTVKFPRQFSRMMHSGEHYQASQWYPKLAVYDRRGWAAYPYRDCGEFYSEFGVLDVSITVPANYIVAATGILRTEAEIAWRDSLAEVGNKLYALDKKAKKKAFKKLARKKPVSSDSMKTVRFWQDRVHDFAWFADKKYVIQKGVWESAETGREVNLWVYSLPKDYKAWEGSIETLNKTLEHYGTLYGEYPYTDVSAAASKVNFGGGMEYPMISINASFPIPDLMEMVLVHETGHNWFQGILGTDERKHSWMDEGFNNFSDSEFTVAEHSEDYVTMTPKKFKWLTPNATAKNFNLNMVVPFVRKDTDLPNNLSPDQYPDQLVHQCLTSDKTAAGLRYLQDYIGGEKFDAMMKEYYETWKFKHPMPEDFQALAEKYAGEDLSWYFDDFLGSDKSLDYKLDKVKVKKDSDGYTLDYDVRHEGELRIPYYVEIYQGDKVLKSYWHHPENKEEHFNFILADKPDKVLIDPHVNTLDANSHNNVWPKKIVFQPLIDLEDPHRYQLFYALLPFHNAGDGFTLMGDVYRFNIFSHQQHNFAVSGGYGFKSQNPLYRLKYDNHIYYNRSRNKYGWNLTAKDNYGHRQYAVKIDHKSIADPYYEARSYWTNTVMFDYLDFYDDGMYDEAAWSPEKFIDLRLKTEYRKVWYLDRVFIRGSLVKGLTNGDVGANFAKADLFAKYERRLNLKTRFRIFGYTGYIFDDQELPLQHKFYGSGGVDPYFEDPFMFDRSNASFLSPSERLVKKFGPAIRGYSHLTGNDYALTASAELERDDKGLFFDGGIIANNDENAEFNYSFGLFMNFSIIGLHLPLYLSDPAGNSGKWIDAHNYDERYYISMTLPNFQIGF